MSGICMWGRHPKGAEPSYECGLVFLLASLLYKNVSGFLLHAFRASICSAAPCRITTGLIFQWLHSPHCNKASIHFTMPVVSTKPAWQPWPPGRDHYFLMRNMPSVLCWGLCPSLLQYVTHAQWPGQVSGENEVPCTPADVTTGRMQWYKDIKHRNHGDRLRGWPLNRKYTLNQPYMYINMTNSLGFLLKKYPPPRGRPCALVVWPGA